MRTLLVGREPRLRRQLGRILIADFVYALSLLVQWNVVSEGLADRGPAAALAWFICVGVGGHFVLVRSGATARMKDPPLTLLQMVFAIVAIAMSYHVNPHVRGILPLLAALVLMFGVYVLRPGQCLALGAFAVVVFGATIAFGALHRPRMFVPLIEIHHFIFITVSLMTMAYLAAQFSRIRLRWKEQRQELQDAMDRLAQGNTRWPRQWPPRRRRIAPSPNSWPT